MLIADSFAVINSVNFKVFDFVAVTSTEIASGPAAFKLTVAIITVTAVISNALSHLKMGDRILRRIYV